MASVIIADNGSRSNFRIDASSQTFTVILQSFGHNLGFAEAANRAAAAAQTEHVLFLNPDARVLPGCVGKLLDVFKERPGIVGPSILLGTGAREEGLTLNHLGMPMPARQPNRPLYLPGSALLTSRPIFDRIGRFDGRYFLFMEDVELCWRALIAGFDVTVVPVAEVMHEGGASAPGGYPLAGRKYETSALRVALRERNTMAMMTSCAPAGWLGVVIPSLIARSLALSAIAAALGHRELAKSLLRGLAWNGYQLPATLRRRRSLVRSLSGSREAAGRFTHRSTLPSILRNGVPRIVD